VGKFFNRISDGFRKFMYGRYGTDQLNMFLVVVCLLLWLLSILIPVTVVQTILGILSYAAVLYALFRMMSRNYDKRRRENDWFVEVTGPVVRTFNRLRRDITDREYRYYQCPSCGQTLRVPRGKGKIKMTCRKCGTSFQKKT
jgi:predicted membrane protein